MGDDFIGDTQVATFTPSSGVAYVTFTVRDDDEPENKELFDLRLILINSGMYLGSPNSVSVIVEASDDAFGVFGFVDVSHCIGVGIHFCVLWFVVIFLFSFLCLTEFIPLLMMAMYLWWSLCTLYLLACQVRVTVGDSDLFCYDCVMSFQC